MFPLDVTREDVLQESVDIIRTHLPAGEDGNFIFNFYKISKPCPEKYDTLCISILLWKKIFWNI